MSYSHMGPQCPHCGRQYVADDSFYYDEQAYTRQECDGCGKTFAVSVQITTAWECDAIGPCDDAEFGMTP